MHFSSYVSVNYSNRVSEFRSIERFSTADTVQHYHRKESMKYVLHIK